MRLRDSDYRQDSQRRKKMMRNLTLPTWKCPFAMNLNHETELSSNFVLDADATEEAAASPPTGYS